MSQDPSNQNGKRQELKDDAGSFGGATPQAPQAPYGQPQYGQAPYGQPAPHAPYGQPSQEPLPPTQQPQPEAQTEALNPHAEAQYGQPASPQNPPAPQYGQPPQYGQQPAPQYGHPGQFAPQQQQYGQPFQQGMPGQPGQPGQFGQFGQQPPFGQSGFQGQYAPQGIYAPAPQRMLGFAEAFQICLYKIFTYEGRASRSEFWFLSLWEFIIFSLLGLIISVLYTLESTKTIATIFVFISVVLLICAFLINLSCTCRRLHDTGKSGWMQLLYLAPCIGSLLIFIFCVIGSDPIPNRYGDVPNRVGDIPELDRIKARRTEIQAQNKNIQ